MVFDFLKRHNNAKKVKCLEAIRLNSRKNKNDVYCSDGMSFSAAVVSDVGCLRDNNEDNYILGKYMNIHSSDHSEITLSISDNIGTWQFAGVFDGMGGGEMGELASHETATIFMNALETLNRSPSKTEVDRCIRNAFLQSNNRIVDFQKEHKIFGTTGTFLCYNGLEYKLYHLGDSRAYLIRGNEIVQLTKDQTLAQMKIEVGMYQEDDPAAEADKHKLTEYIGRDWTRENIKPVESHWLPAAQGDSILLCSDGLYDMCTNDEIFYIMSGKQSAGEKAAALVKEACAKGGDDNVTCIVILIS